MSEFEYQKCWHACFMEFQVPKGFTTARRNDQKSFYCPGCGNRMSYGVDNSDAAKLRRELGRAKQNTAYLEDEVKRQRERCEAEEHRRSALKGQVTKLKKRTAAGVCPCCNRTFLSLARHMAQKHPTFIAEPTADNVIKLDRAG